MSNSNRRKRKNHVRRQRKAERQAIDRRGLEYRRRYPEWTVRQGNASQDVVQAVVEAVGRVRLYSKCFTTADRELLGRIKNGAWSSLMGLEVPTLGRDAQPPHVNLLYKLGLSLYAAMPEDVRSELLLDTDVRVTVHGNRLVAACDSLQRHEGEVGCHHYSYFRPTIEIDGQVKVVSFSRHALRRLYDACIPCWQTYIAHGDAFESVNNCDNYEPCSLPDGRQAFTFYQEARHDAWARNYVLQILGEEAARSRQSFALRMGYCPIIIDGEFAVATDFMFPGHAGTPEHAVLAMADLADDCRQRLQASAAKISTAYLYATNDFSALRWFHEHGVSQVMPTDRALFRV